MPNYSELNDKQRADYDRAYYHAKDAIQNAIDKLEERKLTPGVQPEEIDEIDVDLPQLESDLHKLELKRTAFLSGSVAITPPSDAQIQNVKSLSDTVENLQNNSDTVESAMDLASKAMTEFSKIQADT